MVADEGVGEDEVLSHDRHYGDLGFRRKALSGDVGAAQKVWRQVALLSPSDRVSETRKRAPYRDQDLAKIQEAYRLAGMPE